MSFDITVRRTLGSRTIAASFASEARLTALVGPSGVGKTTVLNCIAGLARPDAGRIVVEGTVLFDAQERANLPPEKRRCGYVFQDGRLFPHFDVAGNLRFGERLAHKAERWAARDEIIGLLGIGHLLDRWPATLSGGEAQRVAIGRALLCGPRFLLLDEPLASLDEARAGRMMELIERIRDEIGIPMLMVSHDRREVERLAGKVVQMS